MEEKEFSVNDLIDQLKETNNFGRDAIKNPDKYTVPKENLEQFVLDSTGKLVTQGLEIVEGVKEYVMNNPESREVCALSEALKAVASALTVVKDIHISQIKRDRLKDIKTMEIESRKQLKDDDRKERFLMSRDEMFKKIMEEAKVIETEAISVSQYPALSAK
jgi:hypothetical protein